MRNKNITKRWVTSLLLGATGLLTSNLYCAYPNNAGNQMTQNPENRKKIWIMTPHGCSRGDIEYYQQEQQERQQKLRQEKQEWQQKEWKREFDELKQRYMSAQHLASNFIRFYSNYCIKSPANELSAETFIKQIPRDNWVDFINYKHKDGNTVLHTVVSRKDVKAVQAILTSNDTDQVQIANLLSITNNSKKTPLDVAKGILQAPFTSSKDKKNIREIIAVLESYMQQTPEDDIPPKSKFNTAIRGLKFSREEGGDDNAGPDDDILP
jgi:hypothetical protein